MNPKLKRLVEAVLDQTRAGRLKWEPVGENSFRATVGDGLMRLAKAGRWRTHLDGQDVYEPHIRYVISDRKARVVLDEEIEESHSFFAASEDLLREARANAFDGDRVLDSMLESIGATAA